jgi:integrase
LITAANGIAPEDIRRQNEDMEAGKRAHAKKEAEKDITVRDMLNEYFLTRKKLKASTKELYQEDFDRYISDWKGIPLRSIDGSMIVERHAEIGAKSKARADGVMRVMRALFNHSMAMHDDVIIKNPVKKLSAVGAWYNPPRKVTYIRPEDLKKWVPAVMRLGYDTSQDFLLLLLFQGSRLDETATLKWKDVNLVSGAASFRETKTGITLEVPLYKFIVERLQQRMGYYYNGPDSYVFPSYGKTGHVVDLRSALRAAEFASGVKSSHHDLRRSFISYCEELEINTFTRKRLVNHAIPLDVTEGYTQFNIEKLRIDIEKVATFILRQASIPYQAAPEEEIVKAEVWQGLSEEQRSAILAILAKDTKSEHQVTPGNVVNLDAHRVRRRLFA